MAINSSSTAQGARPPRFRNRLILLLVGLLVAAQVATTIAVLRTTSASIERQAKNELAVGGRVFASLLMAGEEQLLDNAELLANDFGFKDAVTSEDTATIASALRNHGSRIGADAAFLISRDGDVQADAAGDSDGPFAFPELLERAEQNSQAAAIVTVDERPVQLVLVPVNAPQRVAWTALGFALDGDLARDLRDVTGLEVSFRVDQTTPPYIASTLPDDIRDGLTEKLDQGAFAGEDGAVLTLAGSDWFTMRRELGLDDSVDAYLQSSVSAAMAPFHQLRNQLFAIATALLLTSLVAAALFARRLTRPLNALATAAKRMASGDYTTAVSPHREEEFRLLADAFNRMRTAISEREDKILHQARHDGLTGLPNRNHALALLQTQVDALDADAPPLGVLVFRIADFRSINDQLGQETGDRVLQELAERIRNADGHAHLGARIGTREFLLALTPRQSDPIATALTLLDRLGDAVQLDDIRVQLSLEAGLALAPSHGNDAVTLLRRTELALSHASLGDQRLSVYQPGDDENHRRRLALTAALATAPAEGHMHLVFQPQIALGDNQVIGAEALLRWEHPELGRITPDEFIPLAEQSGHIGTLTRWVLDNGLACCARWRQAGHALHVSINLSARDLSNPDLLESVEDALARHAVPPAALVLEITETTVTHDPDGAQARLVALRELGVQLAIDDFGTGYAFLGQLKRLPITELKIDREFVMQLGEAAADDAIVRSSIELGHRLGLKIVAEGVENEKIQSLLHTFGCDVGQGYGIARPMGSDALDAWLLEWRHH